MRKKKVVVSKEELPEVKELPEVEEVKAPEILEIDSPESVTEKKEKSDPLTDLEVAKKLINIAQSAADRKLDFNLSFETMKRLLGCKTCYYTGRPFGEEGSPYARSVDRVDSSKGYVEDNVVACTVDINRKKSNLSLSEIEALYFKLCKRKDISGKKFDRH